jgi:hypothetical protein
MASQFTAPLIDIFVGYRKDAISGMQYQDTHLFGQAITMSITRHFVDVVAATISLLRLRFRQYE